VKQARFANRSARPRRALARDRLAPAARRHVGDGLLGGVRRAKPSRRASSAAPRCNPRFRFCSYAASWPKARLRARPCCRGPRRGPRPGFALAPVTLRLKAEHAALPVGRTAARRAARRLDRLARSSQVAGDAHGVLHHGEQLHPPLASGANEGVHREGTLQKFRPWPISALTYPLLRLFIVTRRGRRRRDARAPWTRCGEYPRVVDRVEAWWRHARGESAQ